jgi:PhnB protein
MATEPTAPAPVPMLGGVIPYLTVEGALKAADFYVTAFGATIEAAIPPDEQGRTMHVHLYINGGSVMLSDFYPEQGYPVEKTAAFALHLQVADVDAAWDQAVAAGANGVMKPEVMFWGDRYGVVVDPFGVKWSLATTPKAP